MSVIINECTNIQLIEPDGDLPIIGGAISDPILDERGDAVLQAGDTEVSVLFATPKLNANYRFEYLYVDAFGLINPGTIDPVVVTQTIYGFTVDLTGSPPINGYIMRWRVVVVSSDFTLIDQPENLRIPIPSFSGLIRPHPVPPSLEQMTIPFVNPRSTNTYGFSEFRIENLIDPPDSQSPIWIQVYAKDKSFFKVTFLPLPPTDNYVLVARTP